MNKYMKLKSLLDFKVIKKVASAKRNNINRLLNLEALLIKDL